MDHKQSSPTIQARGEKGSNDSNVWIVKYFAIGIGGIMVVFVMAHFLHAVSMRWVAKRHSLLIRHAHRVRRNLQRLGLGRAPLYLLYLAINLIVFLTNAEIGNLTSIAKRLGWVAVANLVLVIFLSLKHTPLAPLSGNAYEKLRPLHKVAGYGFILAVWLHGVIYLAAWSQSGSLYKILHFKNLAGVIAGIACLAIGVSTMSYFYRRSYEVFYIIHITMVALIIVMAGLHRPKFSSKTVIIIITTGCLWGLDLLFRFGKLLWNAVGNGATLTALPQGGVRVRLHRSIRAAAGSHALLWIPAVRFLETHPFTMISDNGTTEFVIQQRDGFTHHLYEYAKGAAGKTVRCSVGGGYGQPMDFSVYDRVVLIAGGSGASFTFSVALALLASPTVKSISFVWTMRNRECILWFEQELCRLQRDPRVTITIYVTQDSISSASSSEAISLPESDLTPTDMEKAISAADIERHPWTGEHGPPISHKYLKQCRPDVFSIIAAAVAGCCDEERMGVGVCGPRGLVSQTVTAVRQEIYDDGPLIGLYYEGFSW